MYAQLIRIHTFAVRSLIIVASLARITFLNGSHWHCLRMNSQSFSDGDGVMCDDDDYIYIAASA